MFATKPILGALLLWGNRNIDIARLGLYIDEPTEQVHGGERRAPGSQQNNNNNIDPAHNDSATMDNV